MDDKRRGQWDKYLFADLTLLERRGGETWMIEFALSNAGDLCLGIPCGLERHGLR